MTMGSNFQWGEKKVDRCCDVKRNREAARETAPVSRNAWSMEEYCENIRPDKGDAGYGSSGTESTAKCARDPDMPLSKGR